VAILYVSNIDNMVASALPKRILKNHELFNKQGGLLMPRDSNEFKDILYRIKRKFKKRAWSKEYVEHLALEFYNFSVNVIIKALLNF
jgi:hypothetical protein